MANETIEETPTKEDDEINTEGKEEKDILTDDINNDNLKQKEFVETKKAVSRLASGDEEKDENIQQTSDLGRLEAPLKLAANTTCLDEIDGKIKRRAPEESPESEPEDDYAWPRRKHYNKTEYVTSLSDGDAPLSDGEIPFGDYDSPIGNTDLTCSLSGDNLRSPLNAFSTDESNSSRNQSGQKNLSSGPPLPSPPGLESYDSLIATGSTSLRSNRGRGGPLLIRRNSSNTSSTTADGTASGWGFYEDCDLFSRESTSRLDLATADAERVTPEYVLEDSLEYQALWHSTAGKRPPQPPTEREKYEQLWAQNFALSQVDYGPKGSKAVAAAAATQIKQSSNRLMSASAEWNSGFGASHYGAGGLASIGNTNNLNSGISNGNVTHNTLQEETQKPPPPPSTETPHVIPLLRERSPFGTCATRSWQCPACGELSSLMIHIPKYQIVQEGAFDVRAEYLVVVKLRFVTFGLWRRYSHFELLANKIISLNRPLDFENTLGSWRCVKRRQKWCRCLDKDYIVLKCFLLERFLHDAVFESTSSEIFLDFLEIQLPEDIDI
eukprot:CAMPEP_0197289274 /NCGR_PEP_ID=MMETSP0890-20130614/6510_1 /TAXON_ID=44058 ORGANISM="Aureoumbra lagunensis, Strain CCMP1510" /NCGR_SAMPLE_ID=MMETSP0890 /ASSEMBLY_ACC=CAM_ASM_000533 /LENGTH=552 /DNA_ID=CAMNT_0042760573 /DNA_START=311 /DNA_END=1969 /DNA_ORIENTATION=-